MALDSFAGGVVDEEHNEVFFLVIGSCPGLDFVDGGIYLFLGQIVDSIAVVAYKTIFHYLEETVCAEELGEVFAGSVATLLIEMHQAFATVLVVLNDHGVLAQHLEEAWVEFWIVSQYVVVEEELVVHDGLCPDVVAEEVGSFCVELCEHIVEVTIVAIVTGGGFTKVPKHDVREEVVGHFGEASHIERSLVLVADFVAGTPVSTGAGGQLLDDASHSACVVSAMVPTAVHIAPFSTKRKAVYVVVFAIVATIAVGVVAGVLKYIIFVRVRRLLGISLDGFFVENTHYETFP